MSNLHSQIMNLQRENPDASHDYRMGHRDARHAAAELALLVDRQRTVLLAALEALEREGVLATDPCASDSLDGAKKQAREALKLCRANA